MPRSAKPPLARRAGVLLVASLVAAAAVAQRPAAPRPVDVARLDAYFARALRDWRVPGMAVAIVKDGQVVLARGYGVRDVARGGAVDEHTLFAIASNSKAFTAAALAMLVDEGKLTWDTRVADVLPGFSLFDDPYVTAETRVRDLLSHRTGLGTYGGDLLWYGTPYTASEVVRRARFLEPAFPFRAGYGYSNIAFIAAGEVVAAVSGMSWRDFVQQRILTPLGMTETVTSTSQLAGRSNVATPHNERAGAMAAYPWYSWDAMAAGGGIIASASNMATWLRLQLGRGSLDSLRLFSERQSATMWTPHTPRAIGDADRRRFPSTHFRAYALGWEVLDYQGRMVVRHGGAYDGMYSRVALVPEEGLGVVILTNAMTDVQDALAYVVLDAYLGAPFTDWSADFLPRYRQALTEETARRVAAVEQRIAGTRTSLAPEGYAGTYGGPMYGDATVTADSGRLVLRFLPAPDLVGDLTHLHHDVFRVTWRHDFPWFGDGTVQFVLGRDGKVAEMKVDVPNGDFWFTELEFRRTR